MNSNDWIVNITNILSDLVQDNAELFTTLGLNLMLALGTILFVMFGAKCALSGDMDWQGFIRLVLLISTASAIMKSYSTPVGYLGGKSFPQLIIAGPQALAKEVGGTRTQQLDAAFENLLKTNPPGVLQDITQTFTYWVIRLLIEGCRATLFFVMGYGFIAQGICVLVGPVFIPFLLFEPMAFMFWGWFKTMLSYSFYPVIVALYTQVFGSYLLTMIGNTVSLSEAAALFPFIIVFIVGLLSAPALVRSLFSGSSDGGGMGSVIARLAPK